MEIMEIFSEHDPEIVERATREVINDLARVGVEFDLSNPFVISSMERKIGSIEEGKAIRKRVGNRSCSEAVKERIKKEGVLHFTMDSSIPKGKVKHIEAIPRKGTTAATRPAKG